MSDLTVMTFRQCSPAVYSQHHSFPETVTEVRLIAPGETDSILEAFANFLRGCGYPVPPDRVLTFMPEDEA